MKHFVGRHKNKSIKTLNIFVDEHEDEDAIVNRISYVFSSSIVLFLILKSYILKI